MEEEDTYNEEDFSATEQQQQQQIIAEQQQQQIIAEQQQQQIIAEQINRKIGEMYGPYTYTLHASIVEDDTNDTPFYYRIIDEFIKNGKFYKSLLSRRLFGKIMPNIECNLISETEYKDMTDFKLPWPATINKTTFTAIDDDSKATMAGEEMSESYLNAKYTGFKPDSSFVGQFINIKFAYYVDVHYYNGQHVRFPLILATFTFFNSNIAILDSLAGFPKNEILYNLYPPLTNISGIDLVLPLISIGSYKNTLLYLSSLDEASTYYDRYDFISKSELESEKKIYKFDEIVVPNNLKEYTPAGIKGRLSTIHKNNLEFGKLYQRFLNSGGIKKDIQFMIKKDGNLTANAADPLAIKFVKSKTTELMERLNMLKQKYNRNGDANNLITFYESNVIIMLASGFKKTKKRTSTKKTKKTKTKKKR